MDLMSFKLPAPLRARVAMEARRRRVSQATVVRECIETALPKGPARRGELSCADLAGELIGSIRGPRDLSTSRRYLHEAVAADARRGRKRHR